MHWEPPLCRPVGIHNISGGRLRSVAVTGKTAGAEAAAEGAWARELATQVADELSQLPFAVHPLSQYTHYFGTTGLASTQYIRTVSTVPLSKQDLKMLLSFSLFFMLWLVIWTR